MSTQLNTLGDLRIALHCIAKSGMFRKLDPMVYEPELRLLVCEINLTLSAVIEKTKWDMMEVE